VWRLSAKVEVELPEEELVWYEWLEEGKPYREFLISAEVLNPAMKVAMAECRKEPEF
jgi:hypothetical protein